MEATGVQVVRLPATALYLHPSGSCDAHTGLDRLQAYGTDLRRVAVYAGGALLPDHEALCLIAVRGAWLSLETSEVEWLGPLRRLIEAGWSGQLLLFVGSCHRLDEPVTALGNADLAPELREEILISNPVRYLTEEPLI